MKSAQQEEENTEASGTESMSQIEGEHQGWNQAVDTNFNLFLDFDVAIASHRLSAIFRMSSWLNASFGGNMHCLAQSGVAVFIG